MEFQGINNNMELLYKCIDNLQVQIPINLWKLLLKSQQFIFIEHIDSSSVVKTIKKPS